MPPFKLPMELSRRTLLKTGLLGAAFVAAGSAVLALQKPRASSAAGKYKILSDGEAGVLDALVSRLCPAQGPGAPGGVAIGLTPYIDRMLAYSDSETQQGLKLGLLIFDNGLTGALFGERARPFSQLAPADQDRVLAGWQSSNVPFRRTLYRGLAYSIIATYWSLPEAWGRIGYGGPPDVAGLRATYAENLVDLDSLRPASGT